MQDILTLTRLRRARDFIGPPSAARVIDMLCTWVLALSMSIIQIRNVPKALHRRLKARAALAGMSLSDLLLEEIRRVAERPTIEELRARLERRAPASPKETSERAVRAERDAG